MGKRINLERREQRKKLLECAGITDVAGVQGLVPRGGAHRLGTACKVSWGRNWAAPGTTFATRKQRTAADGQCELRLHCEKPLKSSLGEMEFRYPETGKASLSHNW